MLQGPGRTPHSPGVPTGRLRISLCKDCISSETAGPPPKGHEGRIAGAAVAFSRSMKTRRSHFGDTAGWGSSAWEVVRNLAALVLVVFGAGAAIASLTAVLGAIVFAVARLLRVLLGPLTAAAAV